MLDPLNIPKVGHEELLSRFIVQSSHYRRSDHTIKPDAFVPHPHYELSVTRHLRASDDEIWEVGRSVANERNRTLYGRADFLASICISEKLPQVLSLDPAPIIGNPNHVNISNWPADKPTQKLIAAELAAGATFVSNNK